MRDNRAAGRNCAGSVLARREQLADDEFPPLAADAYAGGSFLRQAERDQPSAERGRKVGTGTPVHALERRALLLAQFVPCDGHAGFPQISNLIPEASAFARPPVRSS